MEVAQQTPGSLTSHTAETEVQVFVLSLMSYLTEYES